MIEKIIIDYLEDNTNYLVFAERPTDKPEKYLIVEKLGSYNINRNMEGASVAVQSYGPTLLDCAVMNKEIKTAMENMNVDRVTGCTLNSDYNFTDTKTKEYRYQAVFDLVMYKGDI